MKGSCCGVFFLLGSKKCFCSLCLGKIDGKAREAATNALRGSKPMDFFRVFPNPNVNP